jgi:hypothetical protein
VTIPVAAASNIKRLPRAPRPEGALQAEVIGLIAPLRMVSSCGFVFRRMKNAPTRSERKMIRRSVVGFDQIIQAGPVRIAPRQSTFSFLAT